DEGHRVLDLFGLDAELLREELRQQRALVVEAESGRPHQQLREEVRLELDAPLKQRAEDHELARPLRLREETKRLENLERRQRRLAADGAYRFGEQDRDVADDSEPIENARARQHPQRPQEPHKAVAAKRRSFAAKRITEEAGDLAEER